MNVIINQYKQCLPDISRAVKDNDVKQYIASLLEEIDNKSTEEQSSLTLSNCSKVNIASVNYGTQLMNADHSNKKRKIFEELKLAQKDNNSYYNADGVIINSKNNIEIAALETTGSFHVANNPKETQDYIKAGYGLISMLHSIGRKFSYGDFNISKRIGIFFIPTTPTKIKIWRLSVPDSKSYVKNCIGSVEVPTQAKNSEENLRKLKMITEAYEAIDDLEISHFSNMKIKTRKAPGYEAIGELQNSFKKNTVIKPPNVYIQKTVRFSMYYSSPIRDD